MTITVRISGIQPISHYRRPRHKRGPFGMTPEQWRRRWEQAFGLPFDDPKEGHSAAERMVQ